MIVRYFIQSYLLNMSLFNKTFLCIRPQKKLFTNRLSLKQLLKDIVLQEKKRPEPGNALYFIISKNIKV